MTPRQRIGHRPAALSRYGGFVGWRGQTFWPEAYRDIHGWTLWPQAYGRAFWFFAFDDIFAGVLWPPGSPVGGTVGSISSTADRTGREAPAGLSPELTRICGGRAQLTGWSFERIEDAVRPTEAQRPLLDTLKTAATEAVDKLQSSCPNETPATATERLAMIANRVQAMLDAVGLVRRALEPFYRSLSSEQKAGFDSVGAQVDLRVGPPQNCGDERASGFRDRTIRHIDRVVGPTALQRASLDELRLASSKAAKMLRASCSRQLPPTPAARLAAIAGRLAAMLRAVKTLSPVLAKFYDSLDAEQKSRFDSMSARNG